MFSSKGHASHAENHCVPIDDVLHAPNDEKTILIVMPFLSRWTKPALETVGETIELFRQLFEVGFAVLLMSRHSASDTMSPMLGSAIYA